MASGHLIGWGLIASLDAYLTKLTFTKLYKAKSSTERSMENNLRNIILVFGLMPEIVG